MGRRASKPRKSRLRSYFDGLWKPSQAKGPGRDCIWKATTEVQHPAKNIKTDGASIFGFSSDYHKFLQKPLLYGAQLQGHNAQMLAIQHDVHLTTYVVPFL